MAFYVGIYFNVNRVSKKTKQRKIKNKLNMETVIKLETHHKEKRVKNTIHIDNSTNFKDFTFTQEKFDINEESTLSTLRIQISKDIDEQANNLLLDMGNFTLKGREVELLKEFLSQI